jgi:molybdopterin biosynthesis enzyme
MCEVARRKDRASEDVNSEDREGARKAAEGAAVKRYLDWAEAQVDGCHVKASEESGEVVTVSLQLAVECRRGERGVR